MKSIMRRLSYGLGLVALVLFLGMGNALAATNVLCPDDAPPEIRNSEVCQRQTRDPITGPGGVVSDVTTLISVVAGIAAVIMLIYGGFTYITSGGDSNKIQDAKKIITWSIVGLLVIVLARSIIVFVINRV